VKILFLAANPVDVTTRLRIDEEIREIGQKIRIGTHQLELVSEWAVRAGDVQAALLRHQPDVVHFSGHCSPSSGIILEDEVGNRKVVGKKALADLFEILKDNVRVVVLNACYAKDQAQALASTIDFTIGMSAAIEDRVAIIFAAHFYQSLAFGRSVEEAFKLAVNQLNLEGIDVSPVPELLVRDGVIAAESRIGKTSRAGMAAAEASQASAISDYNLSQKLVPPVLRGPVVQELKKKMVPSTAFLAWVFVSIAISLTTDLLRRVFVGDGWLDLAALIVQSVFVLVVILSATITVISIIRPKNPFDALGSFQSNSLAYSHRALILTGVALLIPFVAWLSLPALARYYNERGVEFQYREQPDLSRAREAYQRSVKLKPGFAQAHYNLATVQEDLHPEKAMEEYRLAISYDSHIYPAYNNLARLYLLRGKGDDYETALALLNEAGSLAPQDANTQYSLNKNLGWANYALKHYAMAEGYLRRAVAVRDQQGGAAAHCLLAYVLKEQGKDGGSAECFYCVTLAPGEKDVEAWWVSDAQELLKKGGSK